MTDNAAAERRTEDTVQRQAERLAARKVIGMLVKGLGARIEENGIPDDEWAAVAQTLGGAVLYCRDQARRAKARADGRRAWEEYRGTPVDEDAGSAPAVPPVDRLQ
jgi:hypothetical protein